MVKKWRWVRRIVIGCAVLFVLIVVVTWPSMFFSLGRQLTGTDIELTEVAHFDDGSMREGAAVWVYTLPGESADALDADQQSLRQYPMSSALLFDGYKRVRWQSMSELEGGADRALANLVLRNLEGPADIKGVRDVCDAQKFAAISSRREGVLIAGWYTGDGGSVSNYFVYVLDLKRRVLIKMAQLT